MFFIRKVLEKEGVTSLEENDKFDYERQQIVSTKVTDDPQKNDIVAETVRPGYIFNGSIIRPQEVIIYTKATAL
jgi:molecular chaperone GrpE (heat shock protein)